MSNDQYQKLYTRSVFVKLDDVEPEWWNKLNEPVPENMQCKKTNCSFAPPGHRKHGFVGPKSDYTLDEKRLVIKYLVHYGVIRLGKGNSVWQNMIDRGYLTHRTVFSLNNFFKRTLLRDYRDFKLPLEIEMQFTATLPQ